MKRNSTFPGSNGCSGQTRVISPEASKSIDGLATDASDAIKEAAIHTIRDIVIIEGARAIEHHEIAVYGTLRHWAELLDLTRDAQVLESIEVEEIRADELLIEISESVNVQAESVCVGNLAEKQNGFSLSAASLQLGSASEIQ